MTLRRPHYISVAIADALRWQADPAWHFSEKMDGVFAQRQIGRCWLLGELMPTGEFFSFDCTCFQNDDIRREPLRVRLELLRSLNMPMPPEAAHGGDLLRAVLSRGGEGVIARKIESPFQANCIRAKRVETFDCLVTDLDESRGTIRLSLNGEDSGWCPAHAAFNHICRGDVIEVAAEAIHRSGKFRSARVVRHRRDKYQ